MLVTGFVAGIFQNLIAQQTLQRITYEDDQTIVELFQIRNGEVNYDVVGNGWYDQGMSDGGGTAFFYLEDTEQVYNSYGGNVLTPPSYTQEQIGNGTFKIAEPQPYDVNRYGEFFDWKDTDGNSMTNSELTIKQFDTDRDALEDDNEWIDLLHTKWILPHSFDDGSSLPDGLWIAGRSREGEKHTGGSHIGEFVVFRWNSSASEWEQKWIGWDDTELPSLQNADLATFTLALNATEGGSTTGNGDYQEGSFATITATSDENYTFQHWKNTDNNEIFSTQNPHTFRVLNNHNLQAVFSNNMSVNDLENTKNIVFPNPFNDFIILKVGNAIIKNIEILDATGKLVLSQKVNNVNQYKLETKSLTKGVYILKVSTEKRIKTYKIIKK